MACSYCGGPTVYDPDTSATVCSACGREHSIDFFSSDGRPNPNNTSTSSGFIPTDFTYHERKHHHARTLIADLSSRLGLSSRSSETLALVSDLTSSSFGAGDWFPVLVSAAAYVVSRRHRLPLSLHEAASVAGCDHRQIGRMVLRILNFLESEHLPDFDAASALDRAIRSYPSFSHFEAEKKDELIAMGRFLIQCMTKWFLTTGRRPLPAVAAVAALVAEVHGVAVEIEAIAKELYARVATSRTRHRELKETLIKVAKALLPWGKDVNMKNLVYNMPLLVRLMESKARSANKKSGDSEGFVFNLDEYLTVYSNAGDDEEDSEYFKIGCDGGVGGDELDGVEISGERLSNAYKNVLARIADVGCFSNDQGKKRKRRREFEDEGLWESWEGRWDFGKKLSLEEVLKKDVGYDMLPPSFVNGIESRERRKLKIEAAKRRINQIMGPVSTDYIPLGAGEDERPLKPAMGKKRRRRKVGMNGIDWEDCIIELLLLHQVDEKEIEEGQYKRFTVDMLILAFYLAVESCATISLASIAIFIVSVIIVVFIYFVKYTISFMCFLRGYIGSIACRPLNSIRMSLQGFIPWLRQEGEVADLEYVGKVFRCGACFDGFKKGERCVLRLACGHRFHLVCVDDNCRSIEEVVIDGKFD